MTGTLVLILVPGFGLDRDCCIRPADVFEVATVLRACEVSRRVRSIIGRGRSKLCAWAREVFVDFGVLAALDIGARFAGPP